MANEKPKATKKNRSLTKKQIVLYSYIGILAVVTVLFGYNVLNYFYLEPMKEAGKPMYGHRTENLQTISESVLSKAEQVGASKSGVSSVTVSVEGPVVYFDVRVNDGVDIEDAQAAAEAAANALLADAGDIANDYNLQLVVANGDIEALGAANREEELAYVKEHDIAIVEEIIANAEKYPTAANIQRANANIKVIKKSYEEEAAAFQARIDALTELTAEQEEALGEIPTLVVDTQIKPTTISTFPSWGAYDRNSETYNWQ